MVFFTTGQMSFWTLYSFARIFLKVSSAKTGLIINGNVTGTSDISRSMVIFLFTVSSFKPLIYFLSKNEDFVKTNYAQRGTASFRCCQGIVILNFFQDLSLINIWKMPDSDPETSSGQNDKTDIFLIAPA